MGKTLLSTLAVYDSSITASKLLRLEFKCEPSLEMPLVWIVGQTLSYMWGVRGSGKLVNQNLNRSSLG